MKTLAQKYRSDFIDKQNVSNRSMHYLAIDNLADLWSNNKYTWIEFYDGSVLSNCLGEVKAYKRLMPFHKNGVSY